MSRTNLGWQKFVKAIEANRGRSADTGMLNPWKRPRMVRLPCILAVITICILAVITICIIGAPYGFGNVSARRSPIHNVPTHKDSGADATMNLPSLPEMTLRPISPEQATLINEAALRVAAPGPAAKPLRLKDEMDRAKAIECLTTAIYYEAGSESEDGQRAVAQVVLNRVRHPAFPHSICAIIYQGADRATGCQFTFTCDGSLQRVPSVAGWKRAARVAAAALDGAVYAGVGNATHYHTRWVVPYWAQSMTTSAIVGAHVFYRWPGWWGTPAAFRESYLGHEPSLLVEGRGKMELSLTRATEDSGALNSSSLGKRLNKAPLLPAPPQRPLLADLQAGKLKIDGGRLKEELTIRPIGSEATENSRSGASEGLRPNGTAIAQNRPR